MCAMSCGYTTILYVYPACLYGAILRRIDNSQNLRRHQTSKDQTACANASKVAKVGSKPRVHARVVAIGSPPRYAPTGPPSGVGSNVEKARHAARVLNGGSEVSTGRFVDVGHVHPAGPALPVSHFGSTELSFLLTRLSFLSTGLSSLRVSVPLPATAHSGANATSSFRAATSVAACPPAALGTASA